MFRDVLHVPENEVLLLTSLQDDYKLPHDIYFYSYVYFEYVVVVLLKPHKQKHIVHVFWFQKRFALHSSALKTLFRWK